MRRWGGRLARRLGLASRAEVTKTRTQLAAVRARLAESRREVSRLERAARQEAAHREKRIDAAIGRVRSRLVSVPSFQTKVYETRRLAGLNHALGPVPMNISLQGKGPVLDLMASHGVPVPEMLGHWDDAGNIVWADLPDRFVVKGAHGAASRGVLPLERVGTDAWRVLTHEEELTSTELLERMRSVEASGHDRPPYIAEGFLPPLNGRTEVPTDLKVYAFYGDVAMIALREVDLHGTSSAVRFRFVDTEGRDLLDVTTGYVLDRTIPLPVDMESVVAVASQVSRIARIPFVRVDLFESADGVVLGEITPTPGNKQWFGEDLDESLGRRWEEAQARLFQDVAAGMPVLPELGPIMSSGWRGMWRPPTRLTGRAGSAQE